MSESVFSKKLRGLAAVALALCLLCSQLPCAGYAAQEREVVHISSAEDLAALAFDCREDSYSVALRVELDCDIDLLGMNVGPIPTFSGVFEGGGHTISGFVLPSDGSHQGLFRYLQADGVISNLNLTGAVQPESTRCQVGGIVGTNYGRVESCSFLGTVSGLNSVGGIAGENFGVIRSCISSGTVGGKRFTGGIAGSSSGQILNCENKAEVNTSITEGGLELENIDISGLMSLDLTSAEDTDIVSDSGGIVGFSTGKVFQCVNRGTVGYQHYGYNVGGIAGRQSGYLFSCDNYGDIRGRKDVGGIVGQLEPYLTLKDSITLDEELATLQALVNNAISNLGTTSRGVTAALDTIKDGASAATGNNATSAPVPTTAPNPAPAAGPGDVIGQITGQNSVSQALTDGIAGMSDGMSELNSALSSSTDIMGYDLTMINYQLGVVMNLLANALSGNTNLQKFEDISEDDPANNSDGKASYCFNYGSVDADSNVGGIAGAMGIEYQFDMDNALSDILSNGSIISSIYETRCVSEGNVNRGAIIGKKENIGGIVGLEELGTIFDCIGYGRVASTEGGYVGGVVGKAMAMLRNCYAMCSLGGLEYVGGIAGSCTEMHDCVSLVGIDADITSCCGAIAGYADVTQADMLTGNTFVHETLGGIDGICYGGIAECVDYDELLKTEGIPASFSELKLSFYAGDELVKDVYFTYGKGIDESELPQVPDRAGSTGSWPEYDYSALYFSDSIEAVYVSRQAALAVENTREGSPMSIALAVGDFADGTRLLLNGFDGDGPELGNGRVLEKWVLRIDGRSAADCAYAVRFLPPEPELATHSIRLYVLNDGEWAQVNTRTVNSYLSFDTQGSPLVFCAVESEPRPLLLLTVVGGVLSAVAALYLLLRNKRRNKRASPFSAASESALNGELETADAAEAQEFLNLDIDIHADESPAIIPAEELLRDETAEPPAPPSEPKL